MILIYTLMGVLLLTVAAAIVMLVFGHTKNPALRKIVNIGIIVAVILMIACTISTLAVRSDINHVTERYDDLMLYFSTVNYSTNEYVRYDYYKKVIAYNEYFADVAEGVDNPFIGAFYPEDWDANVGPINFQLHGDNYGEG